MKEYKEITKENFEDFIKNLSITELEGKTPKDNFCWRLFKTSFDEKKKIDLIFISHTYLKSKEYNFIPEKFELGGAISNETGDVLIATYYLNELIRMTNSSVNIVPIYSICDISKDISDKITEKIKDKWTTIKIFAKEQSYYNDDYTKKYRARETAEDWFVKNNLVSAPEYSYNIKIETDTDLLLEYYINKEQTLKNLVNYYFSRKAESIYKSILCYEEACKLLPTLLINEELKIEKAIKDALKDIDCNMVTVKASKETPEGRKTWIGKIELYALKNCKSNTWILMWKTPLSERKEFHKLFGKNVDLFPEDIDEITFRKKTLYKKGE